MNYLVSVCVCSGCNWLYVCLVYFWSMSWAPPSVARVVHSICPSTDAHHYHQHRRRMRWSSRQNKTRVTWTASGEITRFRGQPVVVELAQHSNENRVLIMMPCVVVCFLVVVVTEIQPNSYISLFANAQVNLRHLVYIRFGEATYTLCVWKFYTLFDRMIEKIIVLIVARGVHLSISNTLFCAYNWWFFFIEPTK